jgi:molybdate transport system ATP-binding protein
MQLDLDIGKTLQAGPRRFELRVRLRSDSQRIVILGASGSGKSLLLKAIAGLIRPDQGHIRLAGRTLYECAARIDLAPCARQLAYLFQDYALFPHLSVRQNIAFGLQRGWFNPPAGVTGEKVEHWLEVFGLHEVAHQFPAQLSGGQRQRTALARALVAEPRALLLDEPFAALDLGLRRHMRGELDELQRRLRVPMVLITHDPEDAECLGDEVLTMDGGTLVVPDFRRKDY